MINQYLGDSAGGPATDLTRCDREPIRIPGAIQPHGALVAIGVGDSVITHASANLAAFFGIGAAEALGLRLSELVEGRDYARVSETIASLGEGGSSLSLDAVRPKAGEAAYDVVVHRAGGRILLEFEPTRDVGGPSVADLYRMTQGAMIRLRGPSSLAKMYGACALSIREITGFDRVMVYRFDADWNGVIIAEEKRGDLEPFLGLHYPASDIPTQARDLYAQNWLRFIADRDYEPVPILPPAGPDAEEPLDLSHSVLRSVSPVHLEYLRNMGVGAAMSISLLKGDRLWGLVACHHGSPRSVPSSVRAACELLGQMMSIQLVAREEQDESRYAGRMREVRASILDRLGRIEDLGLALTAIEPTVLDFLEASGAAVVLDGEVTRIGLTPGEGEIREIVAWLSTRDDGGHFATDSLGPTLGIESIGAVAAGLLSVPIARGGSDRLLWFRPEQIREVDWAGDPTKSVAKGDGEVRLSPRGSFALWKQVVRGRSRPWTPAEVVAASDLRRDLREELVRRAGDMARENQELRRGDTEKELMLVSERAARGEAERLGRMKDEFVATLSHELRTPLNAILGWTHILRRSTDEETTKEAGEVIERNTRVQAKMIEDLLDVSRIASGKLRLDMQAIDLATVMAAALETVAPAAQAKGVRVGHQAGPPLGVEITGDPVRLQQIFWNLLSNAVKFTPRGGEVRVHLERVDSHVEISVSDTGQGIAPDFLPHLFDRFRQQDASTNRKHGGLGLGMSIVRHLVELHGGTIYARSGGQGQGAVFVVALPVRAVSGRSGRNAPNDAARAHPVEPDWLDLGGVRILVVDDESDAREMMRRVLEDCGAEVTTASSAEEGLDFYRGGEFDVVVSDIGMPAMDGYEFIKKLREVESSSRLPRCPAVALTAYARSEDRRRILLSGYQFHIAKPVEPSEIMAVIANLANKV